MERHYGLDWLRIGAFGLLIFYHIGMFFVPWDWHVKTAEPMEWVRVRMLATNSWRIPLLFVVSGYASRALIARTPSSGRFAWERTLRLLVPVLVAMALIIPPQPWVELMVKHGYAQDYARFWLDDYFRFGKLGWLDLPTWNHLWFVVYLWVYTLALALLAALVAAGPAARLAGIADRALAGRGVLIAPIALLLLNLALTWPGHEPTHGLLDDGPAHIVYASFFLFGFLLPDAPSAWAAIRAHWKTAALLALAAYALVAALAIIYSSKDEWPLAASALFAIARIVQAWGAIVALIGIADRWWNRDHPWRATLTEAVFPFYIIHQTIIVVLGWWLLRFGLPPLAEFAILIVATAAGCWLFYDAGRRAGWLRPLIGLKRQVKPVSAPATASA